MKHRQPATFLLINSKGHPDFIMTMLVVVIIALLFTVLFWMGLNTMFFITEYESGRGEYMTHFMGVFNDNAQVIIIGLCSSIFTLAGTYYLRRSSFDKHHEVSKQNKNEHLMESALPGTGSSVISGFVENNETTLIHPNYDDEEEDI